MRTPCRLKFKDIFLDLKKLNEIFEMKLVAFLLLNTLAFNALSVEKPSDFEKGLRVLLELELNKFESCLDDGKADCDDSEVESFSRLLKEGHLEKRVAPTFPRGALNSAFGAEVVVQTSVSKAGKVISAAATSCESGKGPVSLKYRWKHEGRHCKAFRKEAERAALKWRYGPITSIEKEEYSRYARVTFEIYGSHSDLHEAQIVEIKKSDRSRISELKRKKAWGELKEFVEGKQDESPVFTYHLATAQAGLSDSVGALLSLEHFLASAQNQYFHYGAQAASSVIDTRYAQEDDAAVVAAGGHYSLMNYYLNGKQFSKYKAGLSLMRLASSLTFVKPQQLGRALKLLNDLKDNIELVKDPAQRADLEAQVDAQLDNLKAQIGQIGARAKAKT